MNYEVKCFDGYIKQISNHYEFVVDSVENIFVDPSSYYTDDNFF